MKSSKPQERNIRLYLPLVLLIVILLCTMFSMVWPTSGYHLRHNIVYFYVLGLAFVASLLWGYLRHRSWSFYFPLVLPFAVISILIINLSKKPNWVGKNQVAGASLNKFLLGKSNKQKRIYSYMDKYLKSKKMVIFYPNTLFWDVRFSTLVRCEKAIREYPYVLSDKEYSELLKNNLKTISWSPRKNWHFYLDEDGNYPQTKEAYVLQYRKEKNHYFLVPRDYFMQLKGFTKKDLEKFKEIENI
jgi:hypothetical protein